MFQFLPKAPAGAASRTPPPTASAPVSPPPVVDSTSGGSIFGGMEINRVRRKKKAGDGSTVAESQKSSSQVDAIAPFRRGISQEPPQPTEAPVTPRKAGEASNQEPKAFFMRYSIEGQATDDVESPTIVRIRERLIRFYSEYNPSKLANLDEHIQTFKDREDELFELLVNKYGPEPKPLKASMLKQQQHSAPVESGGGGGTSFDFACTSVPSAGTTSGAAFGFVVDQMSSGSGFVFGESQGTGGHGWATAKTDESNSGAAGFTFLQGGTSSPAPAIPATTFGSCELDVAGGDRASTFAFLAAPAGSTETAIAGDAVTTVGGFAFASTGSSDVPHASGPQGFVLSGVATSMEHADKAMSGHAETEGGRATGARSAPHTGTVVAADEQNDNTTEEEEEESLSVRHRREMRNAQGDVLIARNELATAICALVELMTTRQGMVHDYHALEAEINSCVAREEFERADELSNALQQLVASIADVDARQGALTQDLGRLKAAVVEEVGRLAQLLKLQRSELVANRAREEARVSALISEEASALDASNERIVDLLERATRVLSNAQAELDNLELRRHKVHRKVEEKTVSLRAEGDALRKSIANDEAEIAELEAQLAKLRSSVVEKNQNLDDVNEKVNQILSDHAVVLKEVEESVGEETARIAAATRDTKELQERQSELRVEEQRFLEKKTDLLKQLQDNEERMKTYTARSAQLESNVVGEFDSYIERCVESVLQGRAEGLELLVEPIQVEGSHGDEPIAAGVTAEQSEAAGSALLLARMRALEFKILEVQARMERNSELQTSLSIRLQELRLSLPLLEAAKKTAAQAKKFKEAHQKAEEMKAATASIDELEEKCRSLSAEAVADENLIAEMRAELEIEAENVKHQTHEFVARYGTILAAARSTMMSDAPNLLQLPQEELGNDDLKCAVVQLWTALCAEYGKLGEEAVMTLAAAEHLSTPAVAEKPDAEMADDVVPEAHEEKLEEVSQPRDSSVEEHRDGNDASPDIAVEATSVNAGSDVDTDDNEELHADGSEKES